MAQLIGSDWSGSDIFVRQSSGTVVRLHRGIGLEQPEELPPMKDRQHADGSTCKAATSVLYEDVKDVYYVQMYPDGRRVYFCSPPCYKELDVAPPPNWEE